MRWEEPHHPGPGLQLDRHSNPLSPTLQHLLPLQPRLQPPGRVRVLSVPEVEGAHPPDESAAATPQAPRPDAPSPAAPDDANDLRGYHFKLLMGSGKTWALILIPSVLIAAFLAAFVHPLIGAIGLVGAVLVGVVIAWIVADNRAADAFFSLYASQHGLELGGKEPLAPTTPLLRKGDDRYAERTLTGLLAPDCPGVLALYTYEEEHTDSKGNRET